jgi:GntR family transcriptional regulator of arabinose operon
MAAKKKYETLRNEIIAHIKKHGLKQHDKLPTVRELIANFNYSYATVHRTLIEMENEGVITKHHGKGLYVNRVPSKAMNSKSVALIIPKDFSEHRIMLDILSGVRRALEKANISLLVSISNMSHEKEKETIDKLLAKHVDGMVIFLEDHYKEDYSHIVRLKEKNYPFVLIDRYIPELETDYVVINNIDAMARACSYLRYNRSCDEIVFIPSNDSSIAASSSDEKLLGYQRAIRMLYGKAEGTVLTVDEFVDKIDALCKRHKNLGACLNHDTMIPDLHRKLAEAGKAIPSNCHIFGYNNSYEKPFYPTVEQFNDEVGRRAAEILVAKMKNPRRPVEQLHLNTKLILPNGNGEYSIED